MNLATKPRMLNELWLSVVRITLGTVFCAFFVTFIQIEFWIYHFESNGLSDGDSCAFRAICCNLLS